MTKLARMLPLPGSHAVQGRLAELLPYLDSRPLEGRTVFISGGTGFFGYWLLSLFDLLHQRGCDVRVRILSRAPEAFLARQPYFASQPWISWARGDIKEFSDEANADFVIHAATETRADAHSHPLAIMDDILLGTRRTLDHALASGATRALYVSSGAIYGPQPAEFEHLPETATCACDACHPTSAYGEAKRAAEQWSLQFGRQHRIDIPVARCFAFVGPGLPLDGHFAIGNFIGDAISDAPIHVKGDGTPLRSYLYGADLAIWLLQILLHGEHGRAYNVGSDQAVSIQELAETVRAILNPTQTVQIADRAADNLLRTRYVPAVDRAREELGLDVWTTLPEAIRLTGTTCGARTPPGHPDFSTL